MNIDTALRELGPVDMTALRDVILAQDELAWREDSTRQEQFEVHRATESIVMVFVDLERWPRSAPRPSNSMLLVFQSTCCTPSWFSKSTVNTPP
jgi:hypothetical protein